MAIVGDAFGRPVADALDADPTRWDISSLVFIMSSGVRWSDAVKDTLLRHHPSVMLVDTLGSSEALGVGRSVKKSGTDQQHGRFALGPRSRVITDDGRDVVPGSGEIGLVASIGRGPIGYYKDPEKSARTSLSRGSERRSSATRTVEGRLHGDLWSRITPVSTLAERSFPEEVEDVIRKNVDQRLLRWSGRRRKVRRDGVRTRRSPAGDDRRVRNRRARKPARRLQAPSAWLPSIQSPEAQRQADYRALKDRARNFSMGASSRARGGGPSPVRRRCCVESARPPHGSLREKKTRRLQRRCRIVGGGHAAAIAGDRLFLSGTGEDLPRGAHDVDRQRHHFLVILRPEHLVERADCRQASALFFGQRLALQHAGQ